MIAGVDWESWDESQQLVSHLHLKTVGRSLSLSYDIGTNSKHFHVTDLSSFGL